MPVAVRAFLQTRLDKPPGIAPTIDTRWPDRNGLGSNGGDRTRSGRCLLTPMSTAPTCSAHLYTAISTATSCHVKVSMVAVGRVVGLNMASPDIPFAEPL